MGPNWGQQQRMRQQQQQQQQRQQQLQRQRQQQGYWWQQQQKKKQQPGQIQMPNNKISGNIPPIQMQEFNEVKPKKSGCAQVINSVVGLAFIMFVIYIVLIIIENL